MTDEVIKQVPFLLENPVVVMQSKSVNSRITILGDVFDASGKPVLAALELEPISNGNYLSEMKIASAYGKDAPQHLINTSKILYVEPNKNRTHEWLNRTRLQLPFGLNHYDPINIISNAAEKSNPSKEGKLLINRITGKTVSARTIEVLSQLDSGIEVDMETVSRLPEIKEATEFINALPAEDVTEETINEIKKSCCLTEATRVLM